MLLSHPLTSDLGICVVLTSDDGQEALAIQIPRTIKAGLHHWIVDGIFALRECVERVADGHDTANFEVGQVRDEQFHQNADRSALALQALG